jgi:hypothetical protein
LSIFDWTRVGSTKWGLLPFGLATSTSERAQSQVQDPESLAEEAIKAKEAVVSKLWRSTIERERKDAHDLVYCIEFGSGGWEAAAMAFRGQIGGKYGDVVQLCVRLLGKHFASNDQTEG